MESSLEDFTFQALLSIRALNVLRSAPSLVTVADLVRFGEHGICRVSGCGAKTITELRTALRQHGLDLRPCSPTCRKRQASSESVCLWKPRRTVKSSPKSRKSTKAKASPNS
jgi:DNA-directed RNA polymerase alpha subunit